jgi:hypothetical protein
MPRALTGNPRKIAFACAVVIAGLFALYTNHAWEDYYITFRASRNLATGHGLVFNHGDRLHTFTSPLGVLLPALASFVSGSQSDAAALWIYRGMCLAALGGAAALVVALGRRLAYPAIASGLVVAWLVTDAKVLDFTINGMETAFMLLFLTYALWAHLTPGARQWRHLGGAWAGLMWTRPDSFLYIGALGAGFLLFNRPALTGGTRGELLRLYLKAAALTTALYGPWFAWAWWYYGSPVPHTIVAKAAAGGNDAALDRILDGIWRLPWLIWHGGTAAEGAFVPAYPTFPKWPAWMMPFGRVLATVSCLLWLVPRVRLEARVASFAYYLLASYLSFVPYYPFPWYLPPTALLAWLALGATVAQLWALDRAPLRWALGAAGLGVLAGGIVLAAGTARQVRAQQVYIEDGNRRAIGEWLREHAQPDDTVFMEPLGYIGYFSGLKTYDWPGLSSREVPEAARIVGRSWEHLILFLQPNWLVLRANGEGELHRISPALENLSYDRVRDFDREAEVDRLDVPGRSLLKFDSRFVLYHRRNPLRRDTADYRLASPIGSGISHINHIELRLAHAPADMIYPLPAAARSVKIWYGYPDSATEEPFATDGAVFSVWLVDGRKRTKLHHQHLQPTTQPEDRGLHLAEVALPARRHPDDAFIVLSTDSAGHPSKDWTHWSIPEFK